MLTCILDFIGVFSRIDGYISLLRRCISIQADARPSAEDLCIELNKIVDIINGNVPTDNQSSNLGFQYFVHEW
jgi:hypothetical protein